MSGLLLLFISALGCSEQDGGSGSDLSSGEIPVSSYFLKFGADFFCLVPS